MEFYWVFKMYTLQNKLVFISVTREAGGGRFLHWYNFLIVSVWHVFLGVHCPLFSATGCTLYSNCTVFRTRWVFSLQLIELYSTALCFSEVPSLCKEILSLVRNDIDRDISLAINDIDRDISLAINDIDREGQVQYWRAASTKYTQNLSLLLQRYPLCQ